MPKPIPQQTRGIDRLLAVVHDLRSPGGCPWDIEQTHQSLATHLLEEAYETVETIEEGDFPHLQEELGDVLLQVVLHSEIAQETSQFDFDKVAHGVAEKLVRRHPHVYGDSTVDNPEGVLKQWDEIKKQERAGQPAAASKGLLADVPKALPALVRAAKLQKKAAKVGFDWPDPSGVCAKIREEVTEVEQELASGDADALAAEIGDLLFSVVNLARWMKRDPEVLLTAANAKFTRRVHAVERHLQETLNREMAACTNEEQEIAWEAVKRTERL